MPLHGHREHWIGDGRIVEGNRVGCPCGHWRNRREWLERNSRIQRRCSLPDEWVNQEDGRILRQNNTMCRRRSKLPRVSIHRFVTIDRCWFAQVAKCRFAGRSCSAELLRSCSATITILEAQKRIE